MPDVKLTPKRREILAEVKRRGEATSDDIGWHFFRIKRWDDAGSSRIHLRTLAGAGLIEVGRKSGNANVYRITPAGLRALEGDTP